MKHVYQLISVTLTVFTSVLEGSTFNRSFFYRASSFWQEPRFEKQFLTTLDIAFSGGSTYKGRNKCGQTTNILSIDSPAHLPILKKCKESTFKSSPNKVRLEGVFDLFEANFNLYQNFCHGFFLHFHLPVVLAQVHSFKRYNSSCTKTSKKYTPVWKQTVQSLESFIQKCDLCVHSLRKAALSDTSLLLGWTSSFDGPCYSDFIDVTLQAGVLFPTGKKKNAKLLYDISYGYNGHWGFSFIGDIALGACDWLTVGLHSDIIAFGNRTAGIPLSRSIDSITAKEALARISAGPVWRLGTYMKADHFCSPISLLLALAYEQKNHDKVQPKSSAFAQSLAIRNVQLKTWSRWLLHFLFEYDFTTEESFIGPRIGIFYNRELAGKHVFSTHTGGGFLGLDVTWCF